MLHLSDRAIIEISGADRKKFLQGLITNDINKASETNLIYSAMLNAQGRFLYDLFIFEKADKLIIDCLEKRRDEIIKKLNFYKLRAQINVIKNDEIKILWNHNKQGFLDPRHPEMGYRFYSASYNAENCSNFYDNYNFTRLSLKIPESEYDLTYEKSFITEFGFDKLNAISYEKGCYIGQEPTARAHYRGEIRKKIFHIKINEAEQVNAKNIDSLKESEITCEGKSCGIVLSAVFHENELHALALIKLAPEHDFNEIKERLKFLDHKIFIID